MAIEDELKTCPPCAGQGTIDGDRCEECHGRGITRVAGPVLVIPEIDDVPQEDEGDGLEAMTVAALRELADASGLPFDGDREALIKRIRKGVADPPTIDEGDAPDDGLDKLTVAQLRERADEMGIDSTGKKADLLALIRGAVAAEATPAA